MKEPYREGPASHPDPEPCSAPREGGVEASAGEHVGEVSSPEMHIQSEAPTPSGLAEGNTEGRVNASASRASRGQRPSACVDAPCTVDGRSRGHPMRFSAPGRVGKASGRTPTMDDCEKSDGLIVLKKRPNKAGYPAAEGVEGRGPTKGNPGQQNTSRTQCRIRRAKCAGSRMSDRASDRAFSPR